MKHIVRSFQSHLGERGVHFYDESTCNFLNWKDVFKFLNTFPDKGTGDDFSEKLSEALANYNPDKEYLAVHQRGTSVSVELYCDNSHVV
jgi:hypothetical protein